MRSRLLPLVFLSVAAATLLAAPARAQTASGFSLDTFRPSERGSEWFVEDTLDLRGTGRVAAGLVADVAVRPLVIYGPGGAVVAIPLHDQLVLHPGGTVVLFDRLRVGFDLPIAAYQQGTGGVAKGVSYPAIRSAGVGDLRLGADVRLVGRYGDPFTLALGAQLYAPTGKRSLDLSDGEVRVTPRVAIAGDAAWFAYAAHVGFQYRGLDDSVAGASTGSQLELGVSAGVHVLHRSLLVGPELYATTGVTHGDKPFATVTTPAELMLGAHYLIARTVRVGLGAAPGLNRGLGEPAVRYVASVEWAPSPPLPPLPPDRDHDGIPDAMDACPNIPGVRTEDPATNGCPPDRDRDGVPDSSDACPDVPGDKTSDPTTNGCPPDRDRDGIPDATDACPEIPGIKTNDPKTNGCPADRDHDGIPDAEDACPDVAGVKTGDPKTNGCPPDPDRDHDGIPNELDACPDTAGPANADPKKNGCPTASIVGKQIFITEQVKFATGSAKLLPTSDRVLDAVRTVLVEHPEIVHLRVEGHTDDRGGAAMNKLLSTNRAGAVVGWLIAHGIEASRLKSQGYGMDHPVDTNETDVGRQNNRRVEFHIDDGQAQP